MSYTLRSGKYAGQDIGSVDLGYVRFLAEKADRISPTLRAEAQAELSRREKNAATGTDLEPVAQRLAAPPLARMVPVDRQHAAICSVCGQPGSADRPVIFAHMDCPDSSMRDDDIPF
jgi:hypothetical protein